VNNQQNNSFGNSYSFSNSPSASGSQYRGRQQSYQPIGPVQSQYGQNQSTMFSNSSGGQTGIQPSSFHTANYQGNLPNHDQYIRSDSSNPSTYAIGGSASTQRSSGYSSVQNQNQTQSQFSYQPQTQFQSQNTYQAQNSNLNAPTQSSYQQPQSSFQAQSSYQPQNQTQSFHTAAYRGNQPGHDQYLRSDSNQPTSTYGYSGNSGTSFNRF